MRGNCVFVIVEKVSKSGNPYKSLELHFSNGYILNAIPFLTNEQIYILETMLKGE